MVWSGAEGAGFTDPGVEPWLPIGPRARNVADQKDDPDSILALTRDLIELRKHRRILRGAYTPVDAPAGVWAFRRDGGALVALNLGDDTVQLGGIDGAIVLGTDRARAGERLTGMLELRPREAVIVA
jgi:alpha-glucosidase